MGAVGGVRGSSARRRARVGGVVGVLGHGVGLGYQSARKVGWLTVESRAWLRRGRVCCGMK